MKAPSPRLIWVISHCEVFLVPKSYWIDEVVEFTASSKASAERLIRRTKVEPGTWWRLESVRVDDLEGVAQSFLYSRTGRVIKTQPVRRGYRAAIRRYKRNLATAQEALKLARREGRSRKEIEGLTRAILSIRKRLFGHR